MEVHRTKSPPLNVLQAGGHGSEKSIVFEGVRIRKIAYGDEVGWYESLRDQDNSELAQLVAPRYLGKEVYESQNGEETTVIHLENLLFDVIWFVIQLNFGLCLLSCVLFLFYTVHAFLT